VNTRAHWWQAAGPRWSSSGVATPGACMSSATATETSAVPGWVVGSPGAAPITRSPHTASSAWWPGPGGRHGRCACGPARCAGARGNTAHVQAMFTAIIRQHQATGHPVTPATLARIRATLRAALNAAIRHGLITANPACHVELPPARRPHAVVWTANRVAHWHATGERPPVAVWTAAQTAEFLHAIRGDRLYAAFHLIALSGLRRGEAAGLRWCDVDLDDGVAVISQQLQQYDGHMVTCPPKTSHSARVIALDHTTIAALRAHRARQHADG
jgi:integrase